MKRDEYDELFDDTFKHIKQLTRSKGGEYAGDSDVLSNFRRNGANLNLLPEQIWAVYAAKHWDAINQYIRDLGEGTTRQRMEPIAGRADDLLVYLVLFKCLVYEREQQQQERELT